MKRMTRIAGVRIEQRTLRLFSTRLSNNFDQSNSWSRPWLRTRRRAAACHRGWCRRLPAPWLRRTRRDRQIRQAHPRSRPRLDGDETMAASAYNKARRRRCCNDAARVSTRRAGGGVHGGGICTNSQHRRVLFPRLETRLCAADVPELVHPGPHCLVARTRRGGGVGFDACAVIGLIRGLACLSRDIFENMTWCNCPQKSGVSLSLGWHHFSC